jgi:hypothetical protein
MGFLNFEAIDELADIFILCTQPFLRLTNRHRQKIMFNWQKL